MGALSGVVCVWSLLLCVLYTVNGQPNCPRYSLVNVSDDNINNLVFGAFPPDSDIPENEYNPGAIGPWYDIGSGVINVVRPGSITEDVVVPLIESSNVNFSDFNSFTNFDNQQLQDFGQDVATWWAGIIALTLLGVLLAIGLLVCCCCFGLCRCCGNCGGDLKQEETGSTNCLTIVFTIILVLLTCWLIAGVVLAFFSNQQVFDSVSEFEETVGNTFDLAELFINDSVSKVETLLCEVEDTFDVTVAQADGLVGQVNDVVSSFSGDIYGIVDQTIGVSRDIENVEDTLISINATVDSLQANTRSINDSLQSIAVALDDAFTNCSSLMMTQPSLDCSALDPSIYSNGLGANYFEVPNIGNELANVRDIVGSVNLTETALEGNRTFNSAVQQITNLTTDVDQIINDGLGQLREVTESADSTIKNFTNRAVGPDGYIDQGREYAQTGFDFVRQYDTPRYAVGVVISCSALLVVILVLVGVTCGMCGFRTDRAPYERTDLSNCGGIMLICAAVTAFLIGFFILLLSAFVFFAGGVSTKFCEDLAPPDYNLFTLTVDDPRLTGGVYLLSDNLFSNGSIPLTVSGILISCSGNATVYQALKLENLAFIQEIQNFTNISQLIPEVSLNVSSLSDSISNVFEPDSFVPSDLQNRLDDFTTAGVNAINVSQFRQQLNQNILSFNTTAQIIQLQDLRTQLNGLLLPAMSPAEEQRDNIVASIDTTIGELMSIDTQVNSLSSTVNTLDSDINELDSNGQRLTDSAAQLLSAINSTFDNLVDNGVTPLVDNASAVFPRAIGYAQQLVDFGFNALQNEVGNCKPISSIYSGFYNSYCSFTVDGLNGFWLALGMCGVLMIPIIIFAVVTSHYYRRMKYDDDAGVPYESSFPLKTY